VIAALRERSGGVVKARDDAGQENDPAGLDAPAIQPLQARDDRLAQLLRRRGVAEHPMLESLGEGLQNGGRRAKVGVGDP
jgi:hypothetical protein